MFINFQEIFSGERCDPWASCYLQKPLIESISDDLEEVALEQDDNCQAEPLDPIYYNDLQFWTSASYEMIKDQKMKITLLLTDLKNRRKLEMTVDFEN